MECGACGSQLAEGMSGCQHCGTQLAGRTPLVAGIPIAPLTTSDTGPPAAADASLPTDEPATSEFLAVRVHRYRPVVLPPPAVRRHSAGPRAMLGGLVLVLVVVALLALSHGALRFH